MSKIILMPPRDRVQEIAYQTILPYYHPEVIEEYRSIGSDFPERINKMLQDEINHLYDSQKRWNKIKAMDKSFLSFMSFGFIFGPTLKLAKTWEEHLKQFSYNTSGKYVYERKGIVK